MAADILLFATATGFVNAGLPACASLTSCHTCITTASVTNYECYWCDQDSSCHSIGSPLSKCTASPAHDDCVSLSQLSSCRHKSVEQCSDDAALPEQIHLSYAGETDMLVSMRVSWTTPKSVQATVVEYAQEPWQQWRVAPPGSARQYLADSGWHHRALMPNLLPGTTYIYRVGDGEAAWSSTHSFRTPVTGADATVRLSIFGDMGFANSTVRPMQIAVKGLQQEWSASHTYETLRRLVDQ